MVGGDDYNSAPFNLATQGQRQPGSAFKPFVLAEALKQGISPDSMWASHKKVVRRPAARARSSPSTTTTTPTPGVTTLAHATTYSDNSVFAEVGIKVGTQARSRALARRMGIRTPVSHNSAMTLGGLKQGVTPLDMAHAYETFARQRQAHLRHAEPGRAAAASRPVPGPVGIERDRRTRGRQAQAGRAAQRRAGASTSVKTHARARRERRRRRSTRSCRRVVKNGTGTRALVARHVRSPARPARPRTTATPGSSAGRREYTVAVWVGYPNKLEPMKTEFHGEPVAGGTFPAGDLADFMQARASRSTRRRSSRRRTPDDGRAGRDRRPRRRGHGRPGHAGDAADRGARRRRAAAPTAATTAPSSPRARRRSRRPTPQPAEPAPTARDRRADGGGDAAARRGTGAAPPHRPGLAARRPAVRRPSATAARREREPAAQKRHGSSAALVIPIRGADDELDALPARRRRLDRDRAAARSEPLRSSSMPSAWVSLPGPEQRSSARSQPAPLAHQRRAPRAARARGSAPRRRRPRARRPR